MNKTRRRAGRFVRDTRRAMGKRAGDQKAGYKISVCKASEIRKDVYYRPYFPLAVSSVANYGESVIQKVLPDATKLQVLEKAQEALNRSQT